MIAKVIYGKKYADEILYNIKSFVDIKINSGFRVPGLAIISIGNDYSSSIYVNNKIKACNFVGFFSNFYKFDNNVAENTILLLLNYLNLAPHIVGIIIQLLIPICFDFIKLFSSINPIKDVDLLNPVSFGNYVLGYNKYNLPCTPASILYLLNKIDIDLSGLTAVLIGTSNIVGKPLIFELLSYNINIIVLAEDSKYFFEYLKLADIVIVAVGKINLIYGNYLKKNSIIIDVGINRLSEKKIIGDVHFNSAFKVCSFITPVPG